MKRVAAIAVLLLASTTASSAAAQANLYPPITSIIAGNDTPYQPASVFVEVAQQFAVSSPTYITHMDLALYGNGSCTSKRSGV